MWFDWQEKPAIEFSELINLCPVGEYRVIPVGGFPTGIVSSELLAKCDSVFVLCSGTDYGRTYAMFNFNRIDGAEVDQMPYALAFDGGDVLPSGVLIQHGSYPGRTTPLPNDYYPYVAASGTYPLKELPQAFEGSIKDLNIGSQEEALNLTVIELTKAFPGEPE